MTHDERMHQLLYSNEGRVEQCERICRLEELASLMHFVLWSIELTTSWRFEGDGGMFDSAYFAGKLRELGVEVD